MKRYVQYNNANTPPHLNIDSVYIYILARINKVNDK